MSLRLSDNEPSTAYLREECLNMVMAYPYLTEHMDGLCMIGSDISYRIFKTVRDMFRCGEVVDNISLAENVAGLPLLDAVTCGDMAVDGALILSPESVFDINFHWRFYLELVRRNDV